MFSRSVKGKERKGVTIRPMKREEFVYLVCLGMKKDLSLVIKKSFKADNDQTNKSSQFVRLHVLHVV